MARRGIMAKEPALRGQARKEFKAAQREAAASGQAAPTQAQFRPQAPALRGEFRRDYRKAVQEAQAAGQARPGQEDFRARQAAMQAANRPQPQMQSQPVPSAPPQGEFNSAVQGAMQGAAQAIRDVNPREQWLQQQQQQWQQSSKPEDGMMYAGGTPGFYDQMPPDKMYRFPQPVGAPQVVQQLAQMPQMPQPSANMGGQYRLSPGVYGSREQAMQQYNQQMQQRGVQNAVNASGQMPDFSRFGPIVPYNRG